MAFSAAAAALLYACSSHDLLDTGGGSVALEGGAGQGVCGEGRPGCPCDVAGTTAACGSVESKDGDFVTCSEGHTQCQAGEWGPCVGSVVLTKSLSGTALGAGGLRTLSTTTPCDDPCDPNTCNLTSAGPADIDASGVLSFDSGVTLSPNDSGVCTGLGCQVPVCPSSSPTTLTGVVYDPAGLNPVNGALVYVPTDPTGTLPNLPQGASCFTCASLGNPAAVASALTGPDGVFTLTNVPSTDVAPHASIPLVVQAGKWRREVTLSAVPQCASTAVDPSNSRLPRSRTDGTHADLPRIAIATGAQDPLECLLLKMGVSPSEFELPGGTTGSIDYYVSTGKPFGGGTAPGVSALAGSVSNLMKYDLVLFPCTGSEDDTTNNYAANVATYANAGGRIYASHTSYTWLATPTNGVAKATNPSTGTANPFFGLAKWHLNPNPATFSSGTVGAAIDQTVAGGQPSPKGQAFATWLSNVGATSSPADVTLDVARHDVDSVNAPATQWMHHDAAPGETLYFTADTPVGASVGDGGAGACGRVGFGDFHMSTADVTPQGSTCNSNADCGFTATCVGSGQGTCTPVACYTDADCPSDYPCIGAAAGTCGPRPCQKGTDCQTGVCNANGTCGCTQGSQCTSGTCNADGTCAPMPSACNYDQHCVIGVSADACLNRVQGLCIRNCATNTDCGAGELCTGGRCQGCNGPTNCPSAQCNNAEASTCSATATSFPLSCRQAPMSPQEKALEFIMLDMTSCISADSASPPAPPSSQVLYAPATFTEDFTSSCPSGTSAFWREFEWQASIPTGASIGFAAQSVAPPTDGGPPDYSSAQLVTFPTATSSTQLPGFDGVLIDTGAAGVFNQANPPVPSAPDLRLTITLTPTPDKMASPSLIQWRIVADCVPTE